MCLWQSPFCNLSNRRTRPYTRGSGTASSSPCQRERMHHLMPEESANRRVTKYHVPHESPSNACLAIFSRPQEAHLTS
jgi:hypothetical protein